jgi:hypothetical protein
MRRTRSAKQNAYLWVIYREMSKATGRPAQAIHDVMVLWFLPREPTIRKVSNWPDGEVRTIVREVRHTSTLTPSEFQEFIDQVRLFARTFLQLEIPDPDYLRFGHPSGAVRQGRG